VLELYQNCLNKFSFDLSLARGLDYYTGVIYEAVLTDTDRIGSIAAGGRYDNLVGMFSNKQVPAVGVSIGIERIFTILEEYERQRSQAAGLKGEIRKNATNVLVASVGNNMLMNRMKLCKLLWDNNINTEFLYDLNPKPSKQIDFATRNSIPFVVWIGEDEIKNGIVKIKIMDKKEEIIATNTQFIDTIIKLIQASNRPNPFMYEVNNTITNVANTDNNSNNNT
jgi:histidyl-tRNA synthetase